MIEPKIALFLTLDGKAQEAIQFYQETLDATLLFAITNQEYRERLIQRWRFLGDKNSIFLTPSYRSEISSCSWQTIH